MLNAIGHPGCLFRHQSPTTAPRDCPRAATHTGLVVFGEGTENCRVYKVFTCAEHVVMHAGTIIAAHPMLDRDRAELERRREARRRVLEEHAPAESCYLAPLATGRDARELVEQAKAWADRQSNAQPTA